MKIDHLSGIVFTALILVPSVSFADLTIVNPDFAVPAIPCALGYAYQGSGNCSSLTGGGDPFPQLDFNGTPGIGWTFNQFGDGLVKAGTNFQPPSFSGLPFTQAVFLQGSASGISQAISGFSAGQNYVLNFYLGSRFFNAPNDGNQTVEALLNGSVIGTWALSGFTPFTLENVAFTASTSGTETLAFLGLTPGDHTAFLSHVSISSPVPEPRYLSLIALGLAAICFAARFRTRFDH